jgi:hypothetical protein
MNFYQELKDKMQSPEGILKIERYVKNLRQKEQTQSNQLQRFHDKIESNLIQFDQIISKIQTKYESDEYYHRYMNQSVEPPKELYNIPSY